VSQTKIQHTVSVIIPCYNQGHFLQDAIESVTKQTFTNWECIIVDDGSSDNTKEVANNFSQKDERIKYVYKSNGGLSSARNAGIENASGNWIQFLDADDVLEPQKFSMQLQSFGVNEEISRIVIFSDFAFGKSENVFEIENRTSPVQFKSTNYFEELITRWETDLVIPCHSFLISSDFFFKDGIRFDENLPNHEDLDCWLNVFSKNPEVIFIRKILCRYRLSDNSMSTNMKLMGEGFLQVLDKHLQIKSYSFEMHSLLKRKRLDVLQRYKRFDIMTLNEKFSSLKILKEYYGNRVVDKFKKRRKIFPEE
jgi:glycosyltransferase involved in cell wall biosynthesis